MTAANQTPADRPRVPSHLAGQQAGRHARNTPPRNAAERAARLRAARRRGRQRLAVIVLACTALTFLAVSLTGSTTPGHKKDPAATLGAPHASVLATPDLTSSLARSLVIPGKPLALPFPGTGEGAVLVDGIGLVAASADERSVPVASVTKIMTAYLVLKDHPLTGTAGGPLFTMTSTDHEAWIQASMEDESNIEVKAGERLDERQLLQALMIPSADNIADYLAAWDAGSIKAFVAKMNATAAAMHLTGTHFADASGVNPGSRGTAVDMARLAAAAFSNPVLQSIIDEQFIRLPVSGEIWNNYDPAVGVDGIIGGKSGFTDAAQTNLVTAAWRTVARHRVLVICDVINQPNSLSGDAEEDETLLNAVTGELRLARIMRRQASVGEATAAWNHATSLLQLDASAAVVAWPGLVLRPAVAPVPTSSSADRHGWPAGCTIGTFELDYPDGPALSEPVVLATAIGPPPAGWAPPGHLP